MISSIRWPARLLVIAVAMAAFDSHGSMPTQAQSSARDLEIRIAALERKIQDLVVVDLRRTELEAAIKTAQSESAALRAELAAVNRELANLKGQLTRVVADAADVQRRDPGTPAPSTPAPSGPQPLTVRAPFVVVDAQNRPIAQIGTATATTESRGLRVFNEAGSDVAGLVSTVEGNGLMAVRNSGSPTNGVGIGTDSQGRGRLVVRNGEKTVFDVGGSAKNDMLVVADPTGTPVFKVETGEAGSMRGITVADESGGRAATLAAEDNGGAVQVYATKGKPVGGLFSDTGGGRLVITGPAGGNCVIDARVLGGGGSIDLFSVAGGHSRVALKAFAQTGAVIAYAPGGPVAATLTSRPTGAGLLQISDNGTTMVEAGVTNEGVGLVRTGRARAPTGYPGLPGSFIAGKSSSRLLRGRRWDEQLRLVPHEIILAADRELVVFAHDDRGHRRGSSQPL